MKYGLSLYRAGSLRHAEVEIAAPQAPRTPLQGHRQRAGGNHQRICPNSSSPPCLQLIGLQTAENHDHRTGSPRAGRGTARPRTIPGPPCPWPPARDDSRRPGCRRKTPRGHTPRRSSPQLIGKFGQFVGQFRAVGGLSLPQHPLDVVLPRVFCSMRTLPGELERIAACTSSLIVPVAVSSQSSMKATSQPRISASRARTFDSDFSGSRPIWPKMICFQPRSPAEFERLFHRTRRRMRRRRPSPPAWRRRRREPRRTFPRGCLQGDLQRRGIASRYFSSDNLALPHHRQRIPRHQAAILSAVIAIADLHFFSSGP